MLGNLFIKNIFYDKFVLYIKQIQVYSDISIKKDINHKSKHST